MIDEVLLPLLVDARLAGVKACPAVFVAGSRR
jgi:hypothetical protein